MNKLGICIAGLNGAVASTLVAGLDLMRRGLAPPVAMLSEPYTASHHLAPLDNIVVTGWDPRREDSLTSALRHHVVDPSRLKPVAKPLAKLAALNKASSPRDVVRVINQFRRKHRLDQVVLLNLLPTGANAASAVYARAAAEADCPFVNFTPNECGESKLAGIPFAGRDGKTGQTWFKSVLAPALAARGLKITGWYSTNLLGNEDGKVVGHPVKGRQKIRDKTALLAEMLGYAPHHQVQINYYPPRGDNKESWDNIDFEGFLGMPMQIKVNQLYRDSILAAPMCLDLCRFIALAQRNGETGPQPWLSYFFKAPYAPANSIPVHSAALQAQMLRAYLEPPP
jgi:myo-inositol-1-phosphate synthase